MEDQNELYKNFILFLDDTKHIKILTNLDFKIKVKLGLFNHMTEYEMDTLLYYIKRDISYEYTEYLEAKYIEGLNLSFKSFFSFIKRKRRNNFINIDPILEKILTPDIDKRIGVDDKSEVMDDIMTKFNIEINQ